MRMLAPAGWLLAADILGLAGSGYDPEGWTVDYGGSGWTILTGSSGYAYLVVEFDVEATDGTQIAKSTMS